MLGPIAPLEEEVDIFLRCCFYASVSFLVYLVVGIFIGLLCAKPTSKNENCKDCGREIKGGQQFKLCVPCGIARMSKVRLK